MYTIREEGRRPTVCCKTFKAKSMHNAKQLAKKWLNQKIKKEWKVKARIEECLQMVEHEYRYLIEDEYY